MRSTTRTKERVAVLIAAALVMGSAGTLRAHDEVAKVIDPVVAKVLAREALTQEEREVCHEAFGVYLNRLLAANEAADITGCSAEDRASYYVNAIKMALIDPERHAGWPWRHAARRSVFPVLRKRLETSDEPFLLAAAIISAIENKDAAYAADACKKLRAKQGFLTQCVLALAHAHYGTLSEGAQFLAEIQGQTVAEFRYARLAAKLVGRDFERFGAIKLPADPTEQQVADYIDAIMRATAGQKYWSSNDVEVDLYVQVGPKRLKTLVDAMFDNNDYVTKGHLETAIGRLAGEEHKPLLLEVLAANRDFVGVIVALGWEQDAKAILVAELARQPTYLPPEWIKAVANLRDPKTYDDLQAYLATGNNSWHTYAAIKDLPGIDLDDAVAGAWQKVKRERPDNDLAMRYVATFAIAYGHTDALGFLIGWLNPGPDNELLARRTRADIARHLTFAGTDTEFLAWVLKNRNRLVFDKARAKYDVDPNKAPDPNPPRQLPEFAGSDDRRRAIIEKIEGIDLPPNPTDAQVKLYITEILGASKGQDSFSSDDPQVRMLTALSQTHFPLLVDALFENADANGLFYVKETVERTATEENKHILIDRLRINRRLVTMVLKRGWAEDARDALIAELRENPGYLPYTWVIATAQLADPETYDALKKRFVQCDSPCPVYDALIALPNIDMDDAVAEAWLKSAARSKGIRFDTARLAIRHGHISALEHLIEAGMSEERSHWKSTMNTLLRRYTPYRATDGAPAEWFAANRDRLTFDREKGRFVLKE